MKTYPCGSQSGRNDKDMARLLDVADKYTKGVKKKPLPNICKPSNQYE